MPLYRDVCIQYGYPLFGFGCRGFHLGHRPLSITFNAVIRMWPDAEEKGAQKLHEETVLLAEFAAQQGGEDLDFLICDSYREVICKTPVKVTSKV